jgi:hypothetical protein
MNRFINGASLGCRSLSVLVLCGMASGIAPSWAADRHMMAPRVPADQIEQARTLTCSKPASPVIWNIACRVNDPVV